MPAGKINNFGNRVGHTALAVKRQEDHTSAALKALLIPSSVVGDIFRLRGLRISLMIDSYPTIESFFSRIGSKISSERNRATSWSNRANTDSSSGGACLKYQALFLTNQQGTEPWRGCVCYGYSILRFAISALAPAVGRPMLNDYQAVLIDVSAVTIKVRE